MKREFTGRHMAAVLIGGFGIVIAVNFYMAALATIGFGGVVVQNSYVASQKFNTWLDAARQQDALGWSVAPQRQADGSIIVVTRGVPAGARVSAQMRRPLGPPETTPLEFVPQQANTYISADAVPPGRWIIRLAIAAGKDRWIEEVHTE